MAKNKKSKVQDITSSVVVEDDGTLSISFEAPKGTRVELGGEVYECNPVKTYWGMELLAQAKLAENDTGKTSEILNKLIKAIFRKSDVPKIKKRLEDPSDGLDFIHIVELTGALMEAATSNPSM